jgi:hypothetical protein
MSISNVTESAMLRLVFQAVAWGGYADDSAANPETSIVVGLHTADPTDTGNMSSSEVAYTSYARANVVRSSAGWSETAGAVSPVANIDFTAGTGGSGTVSFFSTGKSGGGAAAILWSGTVTPNIVTGSGVTPRLTTATTITLD